MEKFRCPTCLALLDGGEQRCPACHSRLHKRGRPIVLGEASRLTSRPLLPFERDMRARVDASDAADHPWHRPQVSSLAARTRGRDASAPVAEAQPEVLEALLAFEATIAAETPNEPDVPHVVDLPHVIDLTAETGTEHTTTRPGVDIDLTVEPDTRTGAVNELALRRAAMSTSLERGSAGGDIYDIFETLQRKARAAADELAPASDAPYPWPFSSEPVSEGQLPAASARERRRWNPVRRVRPDPEAS